MKAFAYRVATSEENATKLLGEKALPLAGGTSLLNLMKNYVLQPDTVVSITRIPGYDKIEPAAGSVKIGANVRLADIASSADIQKGYPALAQAALNVASPQIRNMGTIGGNLCQRPSCWYFTQESFDCLKRGGTTCPAKEGENEYHAIFGNDGPCVMAHPSSLAPALVALGAKVRVAGPAGAKEFDFFTPKTAAQRETIRPERDRTHGIWRRAPQRDLEVRPGSERLALEHRVGGFEGRGGFARMRAFARGRGPRAACPGRRDGLTYMQESARLRTRRGGRHAPAKRYKEDRARP